jgi:hypothetical protein
MPRVFDLIKPLDNRDTYAITDVNFQKGGLREVADLTAMNAISTERRRAGMIAFIIETGEFYSLTGGDLTNSSWEKIDFSPNILGDIKTKEIFIQTNENSISTDVGENLSLNVLDTSIIRVYDGNSIGSIIDSNVADGKLLFLQNLADHAVIIKNDYLKSLNEFNNVINDQTSLKQIAFNEDENIYIIATDGALIQSNNLENWTSIPDIDNNNWTSITHYDNTFIAVSDDGTNRVVFSTDAGTTWTHVAVELYEWKSITHKNGLFMAVAQDKAMYSVDGLEWSYVDLPNKVWLQIAYGKNTFVAISSDLDGEDDIIYSVNDGVTWTTINKANTNINSKIRFVNDKFYIITDQDIQVSVDGINWLVFSFPYDSSEIQDIIYNNDYYLFIKKDMIYYTEDLDKWHEFQFTNTNAYLDFTIKDDRYYLIFETGIDVLDIVNASDNEYSIYTGTNLNLDILQNSSLLLQFSEFEDVWRVIGGVALNQTLLGLLDVPDQYPVVPDNNNIFLLVNPNDESEDKVIFSNPFPVVENDDQDLVIDQINGLRIRRFNSNTGEIVFAKFTPTITLNLPAILINFDDEITTISNVSVTNDTFIPNIKTTTIDEIFYYKNNDDENTFSLVISPSLPYENLNFTWSQGFTFDTIQDINEDFGTAPSNFTIVANLVDTNNDTYQASRTVTYRTPTFSFTIDSQSKDFREIIDSCDLIFTYGNVTSKDDYAEIFSIEAVLPNGLGGTSNVLFENFSYGMEEYTALDLGITPTDIVKTNSLTDIGNFTFTAVCRYHRPITIDADDNYFDIENAINLSVNFTYPIFTGTTSTSVTELTESDVINNLTNRGNAELLRTFTQVVDSSNLNFWFCLRKRYVNGRTPSVLLSSNGFSANTVIIGSNEVEIDTYSDSETYVCYYVLLQANNTYSISISI